MVRNRKIVGNLVLFTEKETFKSMTVKQELFPFPGLELSVLGFFLSHIHAEPPLNKEHGPVSLGL